MQIAEDSLSKKAFNNSLFSLRYIADLLDGKVVHDIKFQAKTKSKTYNIYKIKHALYVEKRKKKSGYL